MTKHSQAILRIGTRGSPLALAQAKETRRRLLAAHGGLTEQDIELVVIKTTGDRIQDRSLAAAGGKGLFTKELEEHLSAGDIDLAVHSMKDVPTILPDGLGILCLLPREDVRDALIARECRSLTDLPKGAHIGTASLRRQAQLLRHRPDFRVTTLRGNVETRLRKVSEGAFDATLLAMAGLRRLGLLEHAGAPIAVSELLPAVAQGAVGIECRVDDRRVADLLAPLDHAETRTTVTAERALLAALDGSCRTPIAALAELAGDRLHLRAEILKPDGSQSVVTERVGGVQDAAAMGSDAGAELKRRGGPGFFTVV